MTREVVFHKGTKIAVLSPTGWVRGDEDFVEEMDAIFPFPRPRTGLSYIIDPLIAMAREFEGQYEFDQVDYPPPPLYDERRIY